MKKNLTRERLLQVLQYRPEVRGKGAFIWRVATSIRVKVGSPAGSLRDDGYIYITIDGRHYPAHELAWVYIYGVWPETGLDHKFGDNSDNRIKNLREATKSENGQNMFCARSDNKTGVLGVSRYRGGFRAQLQINGKKFGTSRIDSLEEAEAIYLSWKRQFHPFSEIAKHPQQMQR